MNNDSTLRMLSTYDQLKQIIKLELQYLVCVHASVMGEHRERGEHTSKLNLKRRET